MGLEHRAFTIILLPAVNRGEPSFPRSFSSASSCNRIARYASARPTAVNWKCRQESYPRPSPTRLLTLASTCPAPWPSTLSLVRAALMPTCSNHADDTLTFQRLQCFDFQGLDKYRCCSSRFFPSSIARARPSAMWARVAAEAVCAR